MNEACTDYKARYTEAVKHFECDMAQLKEQHYSELEKLRQEINKLQSDYNSKNLDYWELSGKVDAYELCIKAFTGMKDE